MAFQNGVVDFCLCPGARNAPFVVLLEALQSNNSIRIISFFDERSAAFFAYGRTMRTGRPVAVLTTSGTAVAELLPAAVEASYVGASLVFVTADRPKRYRGSGAPQCIEQVGIFSHYVGQVFDLDQDNFFSFDFVWKKEKSLQINLCFEEPLLGDFSFLGLNDLNSIPSGESFYLSTLSNPQNSHNLQHNSQHNLQNSHNLQHNLQISKEDFSGWAVSNTLVIVGALRADEQKIVIDFLKRHSGLFFYAESLSGLRGNFEELDFRRLRCERTLHRLLNVESDSGARVGEGDSGFLFFTNVLRLGGVPTSRFWRDLEDRYSHLSVRSFSSTVFPGLARNSKIFPISSLGNLSIENVDTSKKDILEQIKKLDSYHQGKIKTLFQKYPYSEPSLIFSFSEKINHLESCYLGNSMSVRNWDMAYFGGKGGRQWMGNKGANGIDGQIATFLGWCQNFGSVSDDIFNHGHDHGSDYSSDYSSDRSSNRPCYWAFLGDLTVLYDLNSLAIKLLDERISVRLVVMNNYGGRIFHQMFSSPLFQNNHSLSFKSVAQQFGWDFLRWEGFPNDFPSCLSEFEQSKKLFIEWIPDNEQTEQFWKSYKSL